MAPTTDTKLLALQVRVHLAPSKLYCADMKNKYLSHSVESDLSPTPTEIGVNDQGSIKRDPESYEEEFNLQVWTCQMLYHKKSSSDCAELCLCISQAYDAPTS